MLACEKEIIYPQDSSYDIIPIETILSNFMSLWGGWLHKKIDVSNKGKKRLFQGEIHFYMFDNEFILHCIYEFSLQNYFRCSLYFNVLCYAFSLHLSDTLLLARLNLSRISMAAKFESLNLKIFSQQNNFSSIKTNE